MAPFGPAAWPSYQDAAGADQNVVLAQGFIENSNVNAIEELVDTLSQQRLFEINVKFIALSEQIDEGGASIMRLPN